MIYNIINMSRFVKIMNNYPEQVKEIESIDTTTFTLFSGEKVGEGASIYFGSGNLVYPNLEIYSEANDGGSITADLSKSKKLKQVYIKNAQKLIKENLVDVLKNARVFLTGIDKKNASRITKLFPNSNIDYIEEDLEMEITPSVKKQPASKKPATKKKSASKKKPKAGPSKPNCKKYGCTVKPRNGEFCSKHK